MKVLIGQLFIGAVTGGISGFLVSVSFMSFKKSTSRRDRYILSVFLLIMVVFPTWFSYYIIFTIVPPQNTKGSILNFSASLLLCFIGAFLAAKKLSKDATTSIEDHLPKKERNK